MTALLLLLLLLQNDNDNNHLKMVHDGIFLWKSVFGNSRMGSDSHDGEDYETDGWMNGWMKCDGSSADGRGRAGGRGCHGKGVSEWGALGVTRAHMIPAFGAGCRFH